MRQTRTTLTATLSLSLPAHQSVDKMTKEGRTEGPPSDHILGLRDRQPLRCGTRTHLRFGVRVMMVMMMMVMTTTMVEVTLLLLLLLPL
jgi:hypothetical protein